MYISQKTARITGRDILEILINEENIVFEVTDACNLKCKYCIYGEFYSGFDKREDQNMTFETAKAVIDYFDDLWKKSPIPSHAEKPITIFSFYGGEPLLNMRLIEEVISYIEAKHMNRRIQFAMTSNCLLLDKYMDYLAEKDIALLASLDGNESENGYRVRKDGSSSFKKVFGNIKLLQEKYPEYFERQVMFNAVIHSKNSLSSVYHFIKENFNKVPFFSEVNSFGVKKEKIAEFNKTYKNYYEELHQDENYEEIVDGMFEKAPEVKGMFAYIEAMTDNIYEDYSSLLYSDCEINTIPTSTCLPFSKKVFVKVDGKILPCERIHHKYSFGSVTEGKVIMDVDAVAAQFNSYLDKMQDSCSKCFRKNLCIQCIYNLDTDSEKPRCYGFMNSVKYDKYKKEFESFIKTHPEAYKKAIEESIIEND